ncbi:MULTISPECIES: endo-1,4-beta-xylanase [Micromonospora]|uniref:Beta-xylanase n=1 Tax=Micromonospora solifontis TaxID=2487138 RepID=A0ABX9WF44_9ACTN|nr:MULTISPECIES: endo-1,4-beta-xylanase [Micromonospora]NES16176.1 1,4-beta-xylanase [Micromonospora sp. PPF5-17B]NES38023.1 1,4-beta-xylanase [Micromonospora solifontis]NES57663.1 1,4-beta-xylanase [Micromonospora sp. PPF5-6]RNL97702.1 1,4-beta-xylanase [Micromonospora solifontis]
MEHRTAEATVTVTRDGRPLAGQEVTVAQRDHDFLFGCIGFEFIDLANGAGTELDRRVAREWFELFNFATLPFYWGRFEPERGRPDTARLLATARWFAERGCPVKGHPLAWHTVTADWLRDLPTDEIAQVQRDRITREVTDFAGVIDAWDVINEVVIMPIFDRDDNGITRLCRDLGRIPMVRMAFDAARAANPHATLLLNDFDMSAAYECLIEGVLEAGVRIDALGLQSHMHQGYWGEEKTLAILDRFARYGLPIHFTETTIVSGHLMPPEIVDLNDYQIPDWPTTPEGEQRQADEIVRHYRTLLSHPSVQAITYWGISDSGWLGAPGGFLRVDGSRKPSYEALHGLIKGEWWLPPTALVADAQGRVRFRGFLGSYEVSAAGRTTTVRLDTPGELALDAAL